MIKEITGLKYSFETCLFALKEYKKIFGTITDVNKLHLIDGLGDFDWTNIISVSEYNINNFLFCLNNNMFSEVKTSTGKRFSDFAAFNQIDGHKTVAFMIAVKQYHERDFIKILRSFNYYDVLYRCFFLLSNGYHKKHTIQYYENELISRLNNVDVFATDKEGITRYDEYRRDYRLLEIIKSVHDALKDQKPCTFEQVENEVKKHINLV